MPPSTCPICSGPLTAFRPGVDSKSYLECAICQFIQLETTHRLSLEKQKERYLQHENGRENRGYVEMLGAFIEKAVAPFAAPGARILDFGCGPEPILAELLRERGYAVDTYDLFFQPDESYRGKQYDLILLVEVLEHLTDPRKTLEELSGGLSPGGGFALMTLFHGGDRGRFAGWWYRRDPTHVSFFTAKTLVELGRSLQLTPLFTDPKNIMVLGKGPGA